MLEHFRPADVEVAKKLLWDYCSQDLEAAGITHHSRRGSDKRSQLAANVDDIIQAFVALDSADLIPGIYCEATELLRIPSLSLDPISERVETNTLSLKDLVVKIDLLETKITSLLEASSITTGQTSYAAVASTAVAVPRTSTSLSQKVYKPPPSPEGRDCNLVLFGLPERRSIVETKDLVDGTLEFLANKPVPVKDVFRLGKYSSSSGSPGPGRPRPVLIKLTTQWDRKLILLRKRNLRTFRIPRLFLREDVPPGHKLRAKSPSKVAVQSLPSDDPPAINALTASPQGNQPQSSAASSNYNMDSDSTRDCPSHRASPASLHTSSPDCSRSPSPAVLSSSASSSSTIVQGGSNAS